MATFLRVTVNVLVKHHGEDARAGATWAERLNGSFRNAAKTAYLVCHQFALPEVGDTDAVSEITHRIEDMTATLVPVLDQHFTQADDPPTAIGQHAVRATGQASLATGEET